MHSDKIPAKDPRKDITIIIDLSVPGVDMSTLAKVRTNLLDLGILEDCALQNTTGESEGSKQEQKWQFRLKSKAVEKCRDKLKAVFFSIYLESPNSVSELFRLTKYLEFIAPINKPVGDLLEHTFVHGEGRFYRLLVSQPKLPKNLSNLPEFLSNIRYNCPNHLFLDGPKASKGDWVFPVVVKKISDCDLVDLAKVGVNAKLMKRAHENMERFLIQSDAKTFACEVPVWLQPSDFVDYAARFGTTKCITGHVDVLRLSADGCLEIWDYKPKAEQETKAAQQVWLYMLMLAKRSNLDLKNIRGGYFDENDAYFVTCSDC